MKYLLWILLATYCVFGFLSTVHCKPASTDADNPLHDYADDDDYNYDSYDDKSEGSEGASQVESNDINDPPYFEVSELSVKAHYGENVILNCDVRNFQLKHVIMWYKKQKLIVTGQVSLDKRIEALINNSIKILKVQESDADDYYCTVLPGDAKLHIRLDVGRMLAIYSSGRDVTEKTMSLRQGTSLALECKTFESDNSTIKWSLNGERVENFGIVVENGKLAIEKCDAHHAGIYQCLGDDGSKDPLHGSVTVDVHYIPKVSTHRHHVNTEAGGKAELYCDYKAVPIAVVQWKRNGGLIESFSDKHMVQYTSHRGRNRTVLTVKDVESSDLGEYECEAKNALGLNETKIRLIYEPENPQFEDMKIEGRKVTLHWLVRSVQPLSEAVMDYKINGTYTWSSETILSTSKHPEHTGIWKLRHQIELVPGMWHARVKTRNTFGWSKFSAQHSFKIDDFKDDGDLEINKPQETVRSAGIGVFKEQESRSSSSATSVPLLVIHLSLLGLLVRSLCHSAL